MAKKKRTYDEWFPSFDSWELSCLEMVGIFEERMSPDDFETHDNYIYTENLFETLHTLKNGHELTHEEVVHIRNICHTLKQKASWMYLTPEERKDRSWRSKAFYNELHHMQIKRFLKCIPHTVRYLPLKLGIQQEKTLQMPVNKYPLNKSLVDGICRVFVNKAIYSDKDLPADYIRKQNEYFEKNAPTLPSLMPEGPKSIVDMMAFYMSVHIEKMKRQSKDVANIYATNQLTQLRDMFLED